MSSLQIQQVLSEMRALQSRTSGMGAGGIGAAGVGPLESGSVGHGVGAAQPGDFASLMKNSIDQVASMQNQSASLASAYEAGDKSVDLTKVMLEVQKAGLAFHAMTEVRNKLIDAYQQVMNMSV